jgi:hypothetical protein
LPKYNANPVCLAPTQKRVHSRTAQIPVFIGKEQDMSFDMLLGGAVAFGLALYLSYALVHPEKF